MYWNREIVKPKHIIILEAIEELNDTYEGWDREFKNKDEYPELFDNFMSKATMRIANSLKKNLQN